MPRFNGDGPIVGIDIDGTLGDYHSHFIRFAEMYTGRELPSPRDINPGEKFSKFLGLGKSTYRQVKMAYRQGGMKRSMPCYVGARGITVALRKAGVEVWICTSRPFNQLGNVDGDTRHWLKRHGIQHDYVLWGENKYRDLSRRAGGRVAAVLEDLPEMCDQAIGSNLTPILRDQPYNAHYVNAVRVFDLPSAKDVLLHQVDLWKKENS